jgi:hypothetical protein
VRYLRGDFKRESLLSSSQNASPLHRWFSLSFYPTIVNMDAAIDLSDASKALDLSNIRFQLM